jgi:hypothetical protein
MAVLGCANNKLKNRSLRLRAEYLRGLWRVFKVASGSSGPAHPFNGAGTRKRGAMN